MHAAISRKAVPVVNRVGPLGDPPLAAPERVRTAGTPSRRARRRRHGRRIVRPEGRAICRRHGHQKASAEQEDEG